MNTNRVVLYYLILLSVLLPGAGDLRAETREWQSVPPGRWEGVVDARVPGVERKAAATIALPAKKARAVSVQTAESVPPGLYEVRLTIRPSHVGNAIAFHSRLRVRTDDDSVVEYPGERFARVHRAETRKFSFVHRGEKPLSLTLRAVADEDVVQNARAKADLKKGGPEIGAAAEDMLEGDGGDLGVELDVDIKLTPGEYVYYLVDDIEFRRLSGSGRVKSVNIDKIRYEPGETLNGSAVIEDIGGRVVEGELTVYLEHDVRERRKVRTLPVTVEDQPRRVEFAVELPEEELGYALVVEYVSNDGKDRSEAAEYFNIADNFQRVAIFGGGLATRDVVVDENAIRRDLEAARRQYFNATEYFAWAEDDMVEMSPDTEFWSSGQTNYRLHKTTLQKQIRLAHEQGFAVATYGKFIMSGFKGWQTAYDYPGDHRGQYNYPVGMWEGVNVRHLNRRRDGDVSIYSKLPRVSGNPFRTWWADFMPINPDATPHMVRIAAEECVRSIDMFGWDAIRWDGHPRGAGWAQTGRSGKYQQWAARQTQSLVRYFKDIVARKYPDFRHGYNYLLIAKGKGYDWAVEDYELDELCRGGGLLMNESIGNASGGWTFAQVARNLQTDGDLCRERGGYYLGISYAKSRRDRMIESALWAAAGCRPYNEAMTREVRRYCTRYSQYTFNEKLRRLTQPRKVLQTTSETRLWWDPFVYETPLEGNRRRLVVNLLNLPLQDKRPARDSDARPDFNMPRGTAPVIFALKLPDGMKATGVNLIDPRTLDVTPLRLDGDRFEAPAVGTWKVVVIDLQVESGTRSLASRYGPPTTLGIERPGLKESERREKVVLDPEAKMDDVNDQFRALEPEWERKRARKEERLRQLSGEEHRKALLDERRPPGELAQKWWHGAAIPADRKLMDQELGFGDLTPRRNGQFDIFYARGAMDYRLRLPRAFARLETFQVHNASLYGVVRQRPAMGLTNNVSPDRYPDFDLLMFTGVPHCAIGVKNSYALAEYVESGGGVFFTGGEYAFGKGGYMHTVLERKVLPFKCAGMTDTTYPKNPPPFEPGPDFSELNVDLDFAAEPTYWVRNQVVLKPSTKVFLKSGDRPILVGWELGRGRVACLLVDHRGKSTEKVTAFFDWADWPGLAAAVMTWLAPTAYEKTPAAEPNDLQNVLTKLEGSSINSEFDDLGGIGSDDQDPGIGLPGEGESGGGETLKPDQLTTRVSLIERALGTPTQRVANALAVQLGTVTNLPSRLRLRIVRFLENERPTNATEVARKALKSESSSLHGAAYCLLALAGDASFSKMLRRPPSIRVETEAAALRRRRDLAMAVALYPKSDLVREGRDRVQEWNEEEERSRKRFAEKIAPDMAMLETSPCLGADKIFARLAWLAYLSRYDPDEYAGPFLREWVMVRQYQDYCGRTLKYQIGQNKLEGARAALVRKNWRDLSRRFGALQDVSRPDVHDVLESFPAEASGVLKRVRFTREIQTVCNLMGGRGRDESQQILEALRHADRSVLGAFADARLDAAR